MKIEKSQLSELMNKPMFQLTEPELKAIAFLFDIEILEHNIKENTVLIKFKIDDRGMWIRANDYGPITMGVYHIERKKMSDGTGWGGTVSFASMMKVYRSWYAKNEYEFTVMSPRHHAVYGEETNEILVKANKLVFEAQ